MFSMQVIAAIWCMLHLMIHNCDTFMMIMNMIALIVILKLMIIVYHFLCLWNCSCLKSAIFYYLRYSLLTHWSHYSLALSHRFHLAFTLQSKMHDIAHITGRCLDMICWFSIYWQHMPLKTYWPTLMVQRVPGPWTHLLLGNRQLELIVCRYVMMYHMAVCQFFFI